MCVATNSSFELVKLRLASLPLTVVALDCCLDLLVLLCCPRYLFDDGVDCSPTPPIDASQNVCYLISGDFFLVSHDRSRYSTTTSCGKERPTFPIVARAFNLDLHPKLSSNHTRIGIFASQRGLVVRATQTYRTLSRSCLIRHALFSVLSRLDIYHC